MNRPSKMFYYLEMAKAASIRSTCMKNRCGVIIVKNDTVVATGFNGAPRGTKNCIDLGECYRVKHNIPSGEQYEKCRAVHGEMNALIAASREESLHGSMYIYQYDILGRRVRENPGCCQLCKRLIINAGIEEVIFADPDGLHFDPEFGYGYRVTKVDQWVREDSDESIVH